MLKDQSRISKLSFSDVIKKVSELDKINPAYISSNLAAVERYVVVHGQIILQQFAEFPDMKIQKCAFVSGLASKMQQRHHTRLSMKKKLLIKKGINSNPSASMAVIQSRKKLMRATMTKLINRIWGGYYANNAPDNSKDSDNQAVEEDEDPEQGEEENEEDEEGVTEIPVETDVQPTYSPAKARKFTGNNKKIAWDGESTGSTDSGEALYTAAVIRGDIISVGGSVIIEEDGPEDPPTIVLVEYMLQKKDGGKMAHGRVLVRGSQTLLGNAANDRELFLTDDCVDFDLGDVKEAVTLTLQRRPWGPQYRKENAKSAKLDRARAEDRENKGLPVEYFCKSTYCPQKGAFFSLPLNATALGNGNCYACEVRESETHEEFSLCSSKTSFTLNQTEYHVDDFVFVSPTYFGETKEEERGNFKAGRNVGLRPFVVCQILNICSVKSSRQAQLESTEVKVRRFYRPDDVSADKAYSSDIREVIFSLEFILINTDRLSY